MMITLQPGVAVETVEEAIRLLAYTRTPSSSAKTTDGTSMNDKDSMSANGSMPMPAYRSTVADPPLHALIIGIDEYQSESINNLSGAVADADAMYQYLRFELHVSDSQIVRLSNSQATRATILDEIRALQERTRAELTPYIRAISTFRDNVRQLALSQSDGAAKNILDLCDRLRDEYLVAMGVVLKDEEDGKAQVNFSPPKRTVQRRKEIRKDDAILIFYAGHGASGPAPKSWGVEGERISFMVPYDSRMPGADDKPILDIPDRTLGALLHQLADNVGNNITVIMDCCHSGSGTRPVQLSDPFNFTRVERGFELDDVVPSSLDKSIWGELAKERAIEVAAGFGSAGSKSHVLLAACRESERAGEKAFKDVSDVRGLFTSELINTLRSVPADKVTYKELFQRIPDIPSQTPQCEGHYIDRPLFKALAPSKGRVLWSVSSKDQLHTMAAGSAHGISDGALFSIFASTEFTDSDKPLATMKAATVHPFTTELSFVQAPNDNSVSTITATTLYAFQTSMGEAEALRLHVPASQDLLPVMHALADELMLPSKPYSSVSHVDEAQADLSVRVGEDGMIKYLVRPVGEPLRQLYHATKAEARFVHPVLRAAIRFFWHLNRTPRKGALRKRIKTEAYELQEDEDASDLDEDMHAPLVTCGENLCEDGVVKVKADHLTPYGLRVTNDFDKPLHVWAFYFDCGDLSISEYYRPAAWGKSADASLPGKSTITLGYGNGGGSPHTYYLRPNVKGDIGFIKLFLSTEQVDLSHVPQSSPFDEKVLSDFRPTEELKRPPRPIWDTVTITVVQTL
ncbi:hypothetical protein PENSPDRAFT_758475 [Peniophora sp. CONT]|nr:hypothetical protein PENSPDRAFT_758475 [Peniophora sp. CONT]